MEFILGPLRFAQNGTIGPSTRRTNVPRPSPGRAARPCPIPQEIRVAEENAKRACKLSRPRLTTNIGAVTNEADQATRGGSACTAQQRQISAARPTHPRPRDGE